MSKDTGGSPRANLGFAANIFHARICYNYHKLQVADLTFFGGDDKYEII